ncbi:MAG TPA: hypothetical protein VL053_12635, partial [Arachidicoccus sp.]|nr:hypothetical protein [Arachidicoccus sp.]
MKIRLNIKNRGVKMGLLTLMVITIQFSISGGDVFAQDTYQVGTASVSTEPDGQLFSVAMSGYGYPPEGRFSLEWIKAGSDIEALPSNFISITGIEGMHGAFYAVDSAGNLWKGEADENGKMSRITNATNTENVYTNNKSNHPTFHWVKISTAQGQKLRAVAGTAKQLFALDQQGRLLQSKGAKKKHSSSHGDNQKADFKWEVIRPASDFRYLADLKGQLFAADGQQIARLDPSIANSSWQVIKTGSDNTDITGIRSIAAVQSEERLLVINDHDSLWYVSPFKESVAWRQVGRFNGVTYDVHLNAIGVLNNHLFAISKDHHLFVGRHSTDGNLCANTIAIKDAHKTIAIMGIDLTGFDHTLTEAVKDMVHKDRGIDKSAILINASHTHFPPTAQAYPAWGSFLKHPDTIYLNLLKNAMVRSIEKALDNMKPAKLYFGRGQTNIGLNRASENPDSPLDHTLDVLAVKDLGGKIKSVLFLTPCHAVFNNSGKEGYTLSANFPGVTRGLIKEKLGVPSVFIQGCAGDINPRSDNHVVTGTELTANIFHILD